MKKILIVDDEEKLLKATKEYLNLNGFQTYGTTCPKNGLEVVTKLNPDLIILDIMMPEIDGYMFVEKLKLHPHKKMIPFIFVTAKGMTQDRIKGYNFGCSAYLPKPFDPEELVVIVKNILQKKLEAVAEIKQSINNLKSIRLYLEQEYTLSNNLRIQLELTPREVSIVTYLIKGFRNKEIATIIDTSVRNVERYVTRLLRKTNTTNRTELLKYIYLNYTHLKANDGNRTRE